jgi:hypothetical protein
MRSSRVQTAVSVAEIISAFAVVLTLLYGVSQLKRSRALTSTNVESVLYERMTDMDRLVAEGGGLAEIPARTADDAATLTPGERARYLAYERIFYNSWELAREASKSGLMDRAQFAAWDRWFAREATRRPHVGFALERKLDRQLTSANVMLPLPSSPEVRNAILNKTSWLGSGLGK